MCFMNYYVCLYAFRIIISEIYASDQSSNY